MTERPQSVDDLKMVAAKALGYGDERTVVTKGVIPMLGLNVVAAPLPSAAAVAGGGGTAAASAPIGSPIGVIAGWFGKFAAGGAATQYPEEAAMEVIEGTVPLPEISQEAVSQAKAVLRSITEDIEREEANSVG